MKTLKAQKCLKYFKCHWVVSIVLGALVPLKALYALDDLDALEQWQSTEPILPSETSQTPFRVGVNCTSYVSVGPYRESATFDKCGYVYLKICYFEKNML